MKSITIHGLDDPLDALIREKARRDGLSLNKTIKKLLAEAMGLGTNGPEARKGEFADLCGVWSKEDLLEFNSNVKELNTIDQENWE